jgi:hypothetical protein
MAAGYQLLQKVSKPDVVRAIYPGHIKLRVHGLGLQPVITREKKTCT